MKNRFLPLLAGLLLATGVSAQPCLEVECPTNKVVELGTPWDFDAPTILTNCCEGDTTITILTTTNGLCPQIFTRIWEITNLCADTLTCTQRVTVLDTTPPVLTCANAKTVDCGLSCVDSNSVVHSVLHSFNGAFGGAHEPSSAVIEASDGALYGTTRRGGDNGDFGTVYRVNKDGSGYTIVWSFGDGTDGREPSGRLVESGDGALYGTTLSGGLNGGGTIYKVNKNGSGHTVLVSFNGTGMDGWYPRDSLLKGSDGALYGTTYYGGTNGGGTIYKLNPDGTGYTVLRRFTSATTNPTNPSNPQARLVEGCGGVLYGTTYEGGNNYGGTLFKISKDGSGFAVLHHFFSPTTDGNGPVSELMVGNDGMLYGTTPSGGANSSGTLYRLNQDGTDYSVLWNFGGTAGAGVRPLAGLVEGCGGALYGTASEGGSDGRGVVFKLNKDGSGHTVLWSFVSQTGDGLDPKAGLIVGSDGALYGTTVNGGDHGVGVLFTLAAAPNAGSFDLPTATDLGSSTNVAITVLNTVTNGNCPKTITRTWQATDLCGNTATCSQTLTVVDTTPPVFTRACDKIVLNGSSWSFDPPPIWDACSGTNVTVTILSSVTNGVCPQFITRTSQATDACGNSTTYSQTVTVSCSSIACTSNLVVNGSFETTVPDVTPNTPVNDLSRTTGVPGWTTDEGQTLEVWGNVVNGLPASAGINHMEVNAQSNDQTVSQVVSNLSVGCPTTVCFDYTGRFGFQGSQYNNDFTFSVTGGYAHSVELNPPTYAGNWTNYCITFTPTTSFVILSFRGHPHYTNGIATQGGAHLDNVSLVQCCPCITTDCASNKTEVCGSAWSFDSPTPSEGCGTNVSITVLDTVTNGVCPQLITRTWEIIHLFGNRNTCSQTVTVVDTAPPVLTCASNRTVECGTVWSFDAPTASDACNGTNVSITVLETITNGVCPQLITRTWLATDACGNTNTCSQTVTVRDTTPPLLPCRPDKTVVCGSAWNFEQPPMPDVSCGLTVSLTVLITITNGVCPQVITRTWLAADCSGNTSTCSQTVTIAADTTPPVISCASNKTVVCGSSWSFDAPAAADACSGTNVAITTLSTVTNGVCPQLITRTWLATDACGNTNTCSQTVTVISCVPPSCLVGWWPGDGNANDILGSHNGTLENGATASASGQVGQAFQLDGVNDYVKVPHHADLNLGNSFTIELWLYQTTANPAYGHVLVGKETGGLDDGYHFDTFDYSQTGRRLRLCMQACYQANTVFSLNAWHHAAVTYNQGTLTFYLDGVPDGSYSGVAAPAINNLDLFIGAGHDGTGALSTQSFFPGKLDEVSLYNCALSSNQIAAIFAAGSAGKCAAPVLVCATNKIVQSVEAWSFDPPTVNAPCNSTNLVPSEFSTVTNGVCPQLITRTWLFADGCGNSNTCSQTVTVMDGTLPVITVCPTNIVICSSNGCGAMPNITNLVQATDNSGVVQISQSIAAGTVLCSNTVVTLTVLDDCGNQTNRTVPVTVGSATALITGYALALDGFHIQFATQPGFNYTVEYTDSLFPATWLPLTTISGDGTTHDAVDSGALVNTRFYRLRRLCL